MNNNFDNPQLKSILWSGPQYLELREQAYHYLDKIIDEIDEFDRELHPSKILPTIPVSTIFDYYQTEIFADTNFIFFSLPKEKKTFITMILTSYDFVHTLVISFADHYSINEKEIRLKSEQQSPEEEDDFEARWAEEDDKENKLRRLRLLQGKYSYSPEVLEFIKRFDEDSWYSKCIQEVFTINPKAPSLRTVFNYLVQTKRIFGFILGLFYQMLEPVKQFHFDYKTYNSLYDSIAGDNYNQFSKLIDSWDIEVIKELSILVAKTFPLVLYIESQATDSMLHSIRKDLTTIPIEQKFESSLISTLLVFLIDYVFINIMKNHINDIGRETLCSFFSIEHQAQHYEWINSEVEEMIDFFNSNLHKIQSSINEEKDDKKGIGSDEKKTIQEEPNPESSELKQEHLSVPCSQRMIRKLAEGLVKGNDNPDFPNLVSSEVGDDDAINKLVFLFKGRADIVVKDPYNLQWNKNYNLNGLKLLIYLLHFTGEFENNDPLNALDDNETSKDGISELVKFKNTGRRRIFPVVENAFTNIGRKSVQNAKKPTEGNRDFLEQIVQFWFYCKNSDD